MSKRNRNAEKKQGTILYTYSKESGLVKAERAIENITRTIDPVRQQQAARRRYRALGHTGPKPWFDSWPQGGNANPRRKRREPYGHYGGGFYRS